MAFINDIITTNTVDTEELELPSNLTDMEMEYITKDLESLLAKMDTTNKEYHSYLKQIEYLSNIDTESIDESLFKAYRESLGLQSTVTIEAILNSKDSVTQKYEESMEGFFNDLWTKVKIWVAVWENKRKTALDIINKANDSTKFKSIEVFKDLELLHVKSKNKKILTSPIYSFVKGIGDVYVNTIKEIDKGTPFLSSYYENLATTVTKDFKSSLNHPKNLPYMEHYIQSHHNLSEAEFKELKQKRYFFPTKLSYGEMVIIFYDGNKFLNSVSFELWYSTKRYYSKITDNDTVRSIGLDLDLLKEYLSRSGNEIFKESKRLEVNYRKNYEVLANKILNHDLDKSGGEANINFKALKSFEHHILDYVKTYLNMYKGALTVSKLLDIPQSTE